MALSSSELGLSITLDDQAVKTAEQINEEFVKLVDLEDKVNERIKLMQQSLLAMRELMLAISKIPVISEKGEEKETLKGIIGKKDTGLDREDLELIKQKVLENNALVISEQERYEILQRIREVQEQIRISISGTQLEKRDLDEQLKGYKQLEQINEQFIKNRTKAEQDYVKATQKGLQLEAEYRKKIAQEQKINLKEYDDLKKQFQKEQDKSERMYYAAKREDQKRDIAWLKMYQRALIENRAIDKQREKEINEAEVQREKTLRAIYALQRKSVYDPAIQQKYLDIAEKMSKPIKTQADIKSFQDLRRELALLTQEYTKQQANIGILGREWEKFKNIFARVANALVSFLIIDWSRRIFTGFFKNLIESNQLLEQTQARLKSLIPNTEQLTEVWEKLKEVTITTPFKVQDIADAAVQLKAFGVGIKENIKAVADWSTGVGRDVSDVATAFGKIVQFSPRTALLLSTRGLSTAAFETYVARIGDRSKALAKLIEDTYGGTAERVSLTFKGILSNISDLWIFTSQTIGQPLFESFKSDLKIVYNLLKDLNSSGKETLSTFGEFINIIVRTAAFSAIGLLIGLLIERFIKLKAAIISSAGSLTQFGKYAALGGLVTGVGLLIYEYFKLRDTINEINDANKSLRNREKEDIVGRISDIERLISALKQEQSTETYTFKALIIGWNALGNLIQGNIKLLKEQGDFLLNGNEKQIRNLEKKLALEKENQAQQQRNLAIENGRFDLIRDYGALQEVRQARLGDFFKSVSKDLENQLELLKAGKKIVKETMTYPETVKGQVTFKTVTYNKVVDTTEDMKDLISRKEALLLFTKGLTQNVDISKIREKVTEQLRNKLLALEKTEGNVSQAIFTDIMMMKDAISFLLEFQNASDKTTLSLDKLINKLQSLGEKIIGKQEEYQSLIEKDVTGSRIAQIDALKKQLEIPLAGKTIDQYVKEKELTKEKLENEIEYIKNLGVITPIQQEILNKYEKRLEVLTLIVRLVGLEKAETEEINRLRQENLEKYQNLLNAQRDYNRNLIKFKYDTGGITLDKYLENLKNQFIETKNELQALNSQIRAQKTLVDSLSGSDKEREYGNLIDLQNKRFKILSDEQALLQEIYSLPSATWGEAWRKQLIKLQRETERWRDELLETLSISGQDFLEGVFKGLILGPSEADAERMADLRLQLEQVRAKKQNLVETQTQITIVENEELKILNEINRLERERGDFLKNGILKLLQDIENQLIKMASQALMEKIFGVKGAGGGGEGGWLQDLFNLGTKVIQLFNNNGGGSDILDSAPYPVEYPDYGRTIPRGDLSEMSRPIVNNNTSSSRTTVIAFNGDVYGYEDFKGKVKQAQRELDRSRI